MSDSPTILVVDDHRDIRDLVGRYLQQHGLRVLLADGGEAMKRQLRQHSVDLVVLDIMMPGDDGLTLCRHLRERTELPVILLTAMSEETDRIVGLEMGADDYLTKPFNPRELLARIKAVLRRTTALPPQRSPMAGQCLTFEGWKLDVDRHQLVDPEGVEVSLSTAEYKLLLAFLEHAGRVMSRDQLMDLILGREADAFDRSIDNHVSRLRRKIDPDARSPRLIKTIWGGGYQWIAAVEGAEQGGCGPGAPLGSWRCCWFWCCWRCRSLRSSSWQASVRGLCAAAGAYPSGTFQPDLAAFHRSLAVFVR